MSRPSANFLSLVEKWLLYTGEVSLEHMNFTRAQKYRVLLVKEVYDMWVGDKQVNFSDLFRRLSARDYSAFLHDAKFAATEERRRIAQEYVDALNIKSPDTRRTASEISNDVFLLNHVIDRFNVDVSAIEKAKVVDASDWLIREGMKMGDARAVKNGADLKMTMNKNFDEKQNFADKIPNPNINITQDVSIIKPDRESLSEEERKRLAKKYGLEDSDIVDLEQGMDGIWHDPEDEEPKSDVFEYNEALANKQD